MGATTLPSLPSSFALTAPQREIWFDQLLHAQVPLYNIGGYVEINRPIDRALFDRAIQGLVAGHDVLRTVLQPVAGEELPVQVGCDAVIAPVPFIDLSHEADPVQASAAWMQERFVAPFTLYAQPLYRYALIRLRDDRFRFFFVYHHLVTDGWGISLLNKRLGRLYAALLEDPQACAAPPVHPAYHAFIENDRAYAESSRFEDDRRYWADKYRSLPEPLFRPKTGGSLNRQAPSERQVLWLDQAFYGRLRAFATAADTTPFNVMLGALYVYFTRTARLDELAVGLPILNRGGAAFKDTVGLFINMIPSRFSFGTELSFRELLRAIGRTLRGDYRHQKFPIGELYRAIDFHRSGRRQLIDLQFNYARHDHETESGVFQGPTIALTNDGKQSPLIISVWEFHEHEDVQVDFVYNLAYLDEAEATSIKTGFVQILEQVIDDPDVALGALSLVSPADQQLLRQWNAPPAEPAPPATLVERFESQVMRHPQRTAVSHEGHTLSYAELNRRANQLAHALIAQGVGPDTLVGLCTTRSLEMMIGVLGVLKAGGAYVPLDPDYPPDRLAFMLEDAAIQVLVTQRPLLDSLPPHSATTLCLDRDAAQLTTGPAHNPAVALRPEHLAYVIYTSGSTGRPKGCLVTHANVTRLFSVSEPLYAFSADDVWTLFHSYAFDFSVWEMWGALLYGGRLAVVPYMTSRDPQAFHQLLIDERVTVLNQTPSAFRQLIAIDERAGAASAALALRYVIFGGEALDTAALRPWFERHGTSRPQLVNMYGITETTVHVTYLPLTGQDAESGHVGRPLADLQVWILDAHLQPVPVGVAGEMFVGGAGVSRGYLNRPDLTASRFVTLPLLGQTQRLYRTGDLARQRADGGLDYLGRIDQQVKLRGFRIELGEIEALLSQHAAVQEAVVQPHGDGDNTRLVAYLTLRQPNEAAADVAATLRPWLASRLPDYMLPSAFLVLERFPLTVNGKTDRKALPAPDALHHPTHAAHVAPQTPAQHFIAGLWQKILGVESVGLHDDFFAIGGNSLNGIRFINELNATTQEICHIYDLFAAPTLGQFVDNLRTHHPHLVARLDGITAPAPAEPPTRARIAEGDWAELQRLLPRQQFRARRSTRKNPPAVFILAPPRSGTTLLRVMLGGHPGLFAPPELELLGFNDLGERAQRCAQHDTFWLQGTVRALMDLHGCDAEAAWQRMAAFESQGMDVADFYGVLQQAAAGRLLVDKTPFYSVSLDILRQAETLFEGALYIHLQRHPLGTIRSFENARMERISSGHPYAAPLAALADASGGSTRMAELLWWQCHQNIVDFLATVPAERQHHVKFEDLTAAPQASVQALCDFLGIPVDGAMLDPYQDKKQRMTDGVHAEGHMLGDIKFHTHQGIDAQVADSWRHAYPEDFLSPTTWALAERLGYVRDVRASHTIPRVAEEEAPALSYAQQRLWFLTQLDGQSATYNIPVALRLDGPLDETALRQAFITLVARHDSLRSTFPAVNGAPTLCIGPVHDPLTVLAPPAWPADAHADRLRDWIDEQVHQPFDLANGPLLRLHLLRTGPQSHVLLINMHHIISDGWSMGVLVREWSQLYGAAVRGEACELPALAIRYSDYAAWQKDWLEQGALAAQLAYWQTQLAGLPELLELPTDAPRPAVMRHRGRHLKSRLPADVVAPMRQLGQAHGATLFMTLLAAFDVLLHRYSGQDDVAVGTPIANRQNHQTEGLIGFFINTLVLRSQIDASQPFTHLLQQVRRTAMDAYRHQDVPFELLVEKLNPARSMSHAPLFQVMFMLQAMEQPELAGLTLSVLEPNYRVAKFDLTLTAAEQADGGLLCTWEYDSDLFHADTLTAMAQRFEVLLRGIGADPQQAVGRLPLLTDADWARCIAARPQAFDVHHTVVDQFETQAARHPTREAVVSGTQRLSYAELNRRANQLAGLLHESGVPPGTLIGLCMERSPELLVGLLGILKAGCAYLPLDPDQPLERMHFILQDAAVPMLLTQSSLLERLPALAAVHVVALDREAETLARYHAGNLPRSASSAHLAYVIYTSGSTGQPKGCQVTHANISRLFSATAAWFGFHERDVWTLFHSSAFDFSVWEIWGALLHGGKLVVVPYLTSRDPQAFYQLLIDERVTVLNQTPSAFRQLISVDDRPQQLALREVIFGGEALDPAILRPWFERHGSAQPRLVNMYGITETTVHVTWCPLGDTSAAMQGDIGIPIPDLQVWILDAWQQPQPDGIPGEMYVGGAGVAAGYLNRPELTAQRFIELDLPGGRQRLYRTGDLARRRPDGSLDYQGRIDHQVKLRGFRIELGEIEAALNQHPAVQESVVLLDDTPDRARLLAFVVPASHPAPASLTDELRAGLRSRLPDYMVPAAFDILPVLPLTGNGKIDRRALADRARQAVVPSAAVATEPPRTPDEHRLRDVWADVLRLPAERIGRDDNFFHLGGHSLLATQLMSRIRSAFAIDLPLRQLFERPTIHELSELVTAMTTTNDDCLEMEEGEL